MMKLFADFHVFLYRLTGGLLGNWDWGQGALLLLTTKGRKSGKLRTTPLGFFRAEQYNVVIASNYGADKPPSWYLNLKANPQVEVQVKRKRYTAQAEVLSGAAYDTVWPKLVAAAPRYARYQEQTSRKIPLVALREK